MVDNQSPSYMSENSIRNNGPDAIALERFKLCELAEGLATY